LLTDHSRKIEKYSASAARACRSSSARASDTASFGGTGSLLAGERLLISSVWDRAGRLGIESHQELPDAAQGSVRQ
jgi:hypothetical protein